MVSSLCTQLQVAGLVQVVLHAGVYRQLSCTEHGLWHKSRSLASFVCPVAVCLLVLVLWLGKVAVHLVGSCAALVPPAQFVCNHGGATTTCHAVNQAGSSTLGRTTDRDKLHTAVLLGMPCALSAGREHCMCQGLCVRVWVCTGAQSSVSPVSLVMLYQCMLRWVLSLVCASSSHAAGLVGSLQPPHL